MPACHCPPIQPAARRGKEGQQERASSSVGQAAFFVPGESGPFTLIAISGLFSDRRGRPAAAPRASVA